MLSFLALQDTVPLLDLTKEKEKSEVRYSGSILLLRLRNLAPDFILSI